MAKKEVYVSVYEVSRCYGGPEEGGWWYNWLEYTGRSLCRRVKKAARVAEALRAELLDDQPRFGIYSAANYGEAEYRVIIEDRPGECASTEAPRYE